jgi:hypothetical protein
MEFKELHYPIRAEQVSQSIKNVCKQTSDLGFSREETSLAIIAQCQIDISYTLALILDEMKKNRR